MIESIFLLFEKVETKHAEEIAGKETINAAKQIIQKVVKRIPSKAVISHSTLLKIKKELNSSGNKVIKLAKILKDDCDVKIEEYFKEHVIGTGKDVESFFEFLKLVFLKIPF